MKTQRRTSIIIAVLVCILLLFILPLRNNKGTTNVIRIGAILPLSGNSREAAEESKKGIQLAMDSINSVIDGIKIDILWENSNSNVTEAGSAFERLKSKGINIFIMHGGQFVKGVAPETDGANMIMAAISTPNPAATTLSNRLIRISPLVEKTINILAPYAIDSLRAKKGAIIYVNNDAYRLYNELFISKFSELNGEIVFSEGCPSGMRDFKNVVAKIAKANPDFIFVASIGEQVANITNQILQHPKLSKIPILGNMNMGTPSVKKNIKKNGSIIRYADVKIAPFYTKLYKDKYGSSPNSLSAQGYSAVMVLYQSICNETSVEGQLNFIKSKNFNTAITPLFFEASGECKLEMMMYDIEE